MKIKNQNWSNVITNKIVKIMEFMDLVNSLEYIFSFPLLENEGKDDLVSKAIVDIDSAIKTFATIGSHSECSDTIEFYRGQTELLTLSFIVKQMSLDQVKAIRFVAKMFGPKISHAKDPRLAANLSNRQSLITQKFALVEAGNLSNILDGFKFELLVAPIVAAVRRTLVMLLSLDNFDPKSNCPQVFFGPPCEVYIFN